MGISILISIDEFTERTGDWIWSLPHCNGVEKSGEANWCRDSANEIIDHLIEHRAAMLEFIEERLGPHGHSPEKTFIEWIESLTKIKEIASTMEGDCRWIAEVSAAEKKTGMEFVKRMLDWINRRL